MHGADVLAVQHLLTAKGFPCRPDSIYGSETAARCQQAKRRLRFPRVQQTLSCGPPLVEALEHHAPFPLPKPPAARVRFVNALHAFLMDRGNWDYAQVRPIPHPGHTGRVRTDCSGAVTYAAELAGCPDPNDLGFNGEGYTGTLGSHCRHIPRSLLRIGDLVLFGPGYPWHHVCAVIELDPDPLLFSHGRQGDPRTVTLSAETAGQARHPGVTFLSFLP